MYLDKIKSWYPTVALFSVLLGISLLITYMLTQEGVIVAPVVIIALLGIFLLGGVIKDFRVGYYVLFFMGVFMFYINRMIHIGFPLGTVYDALAAITFIAVFINNKNTKDWTLFKNPITIAFVVITCYQLFQFFNPAAKSHVAWLVAMRNNTSFLLYVVCFQMFTKVRDVKRFTICWMVLAFIVGVYGCYQEFVGLTDFEMRWLYSSPDRVGLYLIWGQMRKFSMLSDPSSFGLFMGYSSLACLVLAMGPFKTRWRILLAACAMPMLMGMSYSGTRTAIAMVAVGIVFYIILTIQKKETLLATVAAVFFGALIFFGPFYGGTFNRIRSTFNPSEDNSMEVRDRKRIRLQQYVLSHPIGGGLYTTGQNGLRYSAGHELAKGWDADSGYLMTALEMGWIGLIMFQVFFFIVMVKGIKNYFSINDPLLKTLNLTYVVPFLALSVAHFTQDAIFVKPINLVVIATYALIVKLPSFEKKLYSVDLV